MFWAPWGDLWAPMPQKSQKSPKMGYFLTHFWNNRHITLTMNRISPWNIQNGMSQNHEILALGLILANLKHDEARFSKF